jgi:hypothetical protein
MKDKRFFSTIIAMAVSLMAACALESGRTATLEVRPQGKTDVLLKVPIRFMQQSHRSAKSKYHRFTRDEM